MNNEEIDLEALEKRLVALAGRILHLEDYRCDADDLNDVQDAVRAIAIARRAQSAPGVDDAADRIAQLERALQVAKQSILRSDAVICTLWVPTSVSPNETLVDYIDRTLASAAADARGSGENGGGNG